MSGNKQNEPNPRVEQLLESLRPVPDAAAAKALKDELVARHSHADSNGRKPDAMTTIALPHRDSRKSAPRFRNLVGWAALALVIPAIIAVLAIRPPGDDVPPLLAASGTQDQTDQTAPAADVIGDGQPQYALPNTETFIMTSEVPGRQYEIIVGLPNNYFETTMRDRRYPVVYLPSGKSIFGLVADGVRSYIAETDGGRQMPELIVVAIEPITDDPFFYEEYHDPDPFLAFIAGELVPVVDTSYRTLATPDQRVFVTGAFAYQAMFAHPELFGRILSLIPGEAAEGRQFTELEEAYAAEHASLPVRLYISATSYQSFFVERYVRALTNRGYEGLETEYAFIDNRSVGGYAESLFNGLRHLLND